MKAINTADAACIPGVPLKRSTQNPNRKARPSSSQLGISNGRSKMKMI
jgi:hypothetical protein